MNKLSSNGALRLPASVAGVRLPDTVLARSAAELAWSASPEYLYNHCVRTFVFASLVYARAGTRCDEELVFIAAILHDLGLVPEFMSAEARFEIDGADAAERFMMTHDVPAERRDIVWESIALHAGGGAIAQRRGPEVAAVGLGAAIDVSGLKIAEFTGAELQQTLEAFPRLGFKQRFIESIVELCRRKPQAQFGQFTAEIGRRHIGNFGCPTAEGLITHAPFAD